VPLPVLGNPDIARGVEAAVRKTRWRLRVGLVLVLGAVVGAYLGGQRVSACSSSVQPTAVPARRTFAFLSPVPP